jgi:xylose isomerase
MRTYLILKEKAEQWNADKEIRQILKHIEAETADTPPVNTYSQKGTAALLQYSFDKNKIAKKRLPYERLDQITVDILLGAR